MIEHEVELRGSISSIIKKKDTHNDQSRSEQDPIMPDWSYHKQKNFNPNMSTNVKGTHGLALQSDTKLISNKSLDKELSIGNSGIVEGTFKKINNSEKAI